MEHPFFPTTTTRAEALRWLTIAEKLLSARDLMGSKSFASRARDSDPTLSPADQILAVADTLLAGDRRIGNNHQDWYAILRLTPQQGRDAELIAAQYRNLALLLNPQKNKFPFAEQAFRLVVDAWSVLSNPSRKSLYDKELTFYLQPQQQPDPFSNPIPGMHPNFIFFGGSSSSGVPHPLQPQGAVHFSQVQVHANPQVDPVAGGSAREPQNFMSFTSGSNLVFGSGSGSKPSHETMNEQAEEESYSTFAGNVSAAPEATQEQVNNKNEQPQQNYSNVGDETSYNVNVSENVEERIEEEEDVDKIDGQEEGVDEPANDDGSTFWTACPYCYYMYEYPGLYADCTLRCQNCKQAFQAVVIPSPPPIMDGEEGYFCCWGFLPLGFSKENWEKNRGAASSWTPFSPMFTCPQGWNGNNANKKGARKSSAPRVYVDDDEVFVEISESSESDDDDWRNNREKKKKKAKSANGKGASGMLNRSTKKAQVEKGKNVNVEDGFVSANGVETSKKTATGVNARKQPGRVAKNKLDLNVELSNEAEELAPMANQGNGPSRGEDDNIEGIGFFEGLDEFLSSLPILNVVGDDKVVKAA
ncbi:DnaJsubfamily B member 5 [Sesamum alatum]|uniref:DnaJsubfamily B member 5 n=1 Tax=Sesamum alatum TaxID=300844 RepID=A0AAE1Y739_9LAMI|nr:DnaJsubfamily B member 5 [Sesamum alatum]